MLGPFFVVLIFCQVLFTGSTASILKQILTSVLTDKGILAKESARTRLEITHAVVHWACVVMVKQVVKDLVSPPLLQVNLHVPCD